MKTKQGLRLLPLLSLSSTCVLWVACLTPPEFDPSRAELDSAVMTYDEGLSDQDVERSLDQGTLDAVVSDLAVAGEVAGAEPEPLDMGGGEVAGGEQGGAPCMPSPERCDGLDNDCDEQIDEEEWAWRDDRGMRVIFDEEETDLNGGVLRFITVGRSGETELIEHELSEGYSVELLEATSFRVSVSGEAWRYRISRVEDLEGQLLPEPYPSASAEGPETEPYLLTDNLGAGPSCGLDEGLCERGRLQCEGGAVSCVGGRSPSPELCNGEDDDCNGLIDDEVPPEPCMGEGVCGLFLSECSSGEMSSCEPAELLARGGALSELLSDQERCDCYDNDCDGEVDEGLALCVPELNSAPISSLNPAQHCHFRPGVNEDGEPVSRFELFIAGERELGSLTIHTGVTVAIRKPLSEREINDQPGFMPITNHSACQRDAASDLGQVRRLGGQLTLLTDRLSVEQGATLTATSQINTCPALGTGTRMRMQGASGGDLRIIAGEIELRGTLSANGSAPATSDLNGRAEDQRSGGAAGSIWLSSPNMTLEGVLEAKGGGGFCVAENLNCEGPSPYAGGGPGAQGGAPIVEPDDPLNPSSALEEGGAGSGGPAYTNIDEQRGLRLSGRVTSSLASSELRPYDGNGDCDGVIFFEGATRELQAQLSCMSSDGLSIRHSELIVMALNARGRPLNTAGLQLLARPLSAAEGEWLTLEGEGLFPESGALLWPLEALNEGEDYLFELSDPLDETRELLFILQESGGSPQQVRLTLDERGQGLLLSSPFGAQ